MHRPFAVAALWSLAACGMASLVRADPPAATPASPPQEAAAPEAGTYGFDALPASYVPEDIRTRMNVAAEATVIAVGIVLEGAAEVAGLKSGDWIRSVGGKEVLDPSTFVGRRLSAYAGAFKESLGTPRVGSTLEVVVVREGKPVALSLVARPERGEFAFEARPSPLLSPSLRARWKLAPDAGFVVMWVATASPARMAGLRGGDVLLKFAGVELPPARDFDPAHADAKARAERVMAKIAATTRPGQEVELVVDRRGSPFTFRVKAVDFITNRALGIPELEDDDGEHDEPAAGPSAPAPPK